MLLEKLHHVEVLVERHDPVVLALTRRARSQHLLLHLVDRCLRLLEKLDLVVELLFLLPQIVVLHFKELAARLKRLQVRLEELLNLSLLVPRLADRFKP